MKEILKTIVVSIPISIVLFITLGASVIASYDESHSVRAIGFPLIWCSHGVNSLSTHIGIIPLIVDIALYLLVGFWGVYFLQKRFPNAVKHSVTVFTGLCLLPIAALLFVSGDITLFIAIAILSICMYLAGVIFKNRWLIHGTLWSCTILFVWLYSAIVSTDAKYHTNTHYYGGKPDKIKWEGIRFFPTTERVDSKD